MIALGFDLLAVCALGLSSLVSSLACHHGFSHEHFCGHGDGAIQSSHSEYSRMYFQEKIRLTPNDRKRLIHLIWQRESAGSVEGLTAWNAGESFASVGFHHALWHPDRDSTVNAFAHFAKARGLENIPEEIFLPLPDYLSTRMLWKEALADAAQGQTEQEQAKTRAGMLLKKLQVFFARNDVQEAQLDFIVQDLQNFRENFSQIIQDIPDAQRRAHWQDKTSRVEGNFDALAQSPEGLFALLDYISFKGDGFSEGNLRIGLEIREVSLDTNWGLLQVLSKMRMTAHEAPLSAFQHSASEILAERAHRWKSDEKWMLGWNNRVQGYGKA